MPLAGYQPQREYLAVGESLIPLRGLAIADLEVLMNFNLADLQIAVDALQSSSQGFVLGLRMIRDTPDLVARIIALAADEPDAVENAKKLPFPLQVAALEKIGTLTFQDVGGPGNFTAVLSRMMTNLGAQINTTEVIEALKQTPPMSQG